MNWRLLVAICFLLAGPALADVVHLKNGRQIRGEVVEDGAEGVVIKTHQGRLVLPHAQVDRIERVSLARNLLRQAREARRERDYAAARQLLERALSVAEEGEDGVVASVADELARLPAAGAEPEPQPTQSPRARTWKGKGDPFDVPEDQALIRELSSGETPELQRRLLYELYKRGLARHEAGDHLRAASDLRRAGAVATGDDLSNLRKLEFRCRVEVAEQALRDDQWELARIACGPAVADPEHAGGGHRRAAYLLGRAHELLNEARESKAAFLICLADTPVPEERELATLRELARLHSVGVKITRETPGVSAGWRWLRTTHFAVLHQLARPGSLSRDLEVAWRDVVNELDLGKLDERGRIALFLFADEAAYHGSASTRSWMAGHAQRVRTDEELIRAIYLYAGDAFNSRLRHEIAHILVGDALDDATLPAWANEGVAMLAEGEASRQRHYQLARRLQQVGRLVDIEDAVSTMLIPDQRDADAVRAFYVQSAVMFDVLSQRAGVRRTLDAMVHVNEEGSDALRRVGVRSAWLAAEVEGALEERR